MKLWKPVMYYHVDTSNKGDWAIKKSITEAILSRIEVPFSYFSVKNDELTESRIINQLNKDCSCLMIAGSGLYTNYAKSSGWYFPCKTELFSKIKVPIILMGLGCNQNLQGNILNSELKEEVKESIKLINDLSVVSTVRDVKTFDLLDSIGVRGHQLQLDPGNFLSVPKIEKEKRVAIQIAQHAPILGRFDGGEEGRKNRYNNIIIYAEISNYLISKGYSVVFISHDALEQSLAVDLLKLVPELEVLNTDNLDAMLYEYGRCQFSIGMKMHSNIMSFAAGTPFISLYYDVKTPEYLKMIHRESFGYSVFEDYYQWLKEKVTSLMDKDELKYQTALINALKNIKKIGFDKVINIVVNTIKRNS